MRSVVGVLDWLWSPSAEYCSRSLPLQNEVVYTCNTRVNVCVLVPTFYHTPLLSTLIFVNAHALNLSLIHI